MHTVQSIFKLNSLFQMGCIKKCTFVYFSQRGIYSFRQYDELCDFSSILVFFFKRSQRLIPKGRVQLLIGCLKNSMSDRETDFIDVVLDSYYVFLFLL